MLWSVSELFPDVQRCHLVPSRRPVLRLHTHSTADSHVPGKLSLCVVLLWTWRNWTDTRLVCSSWSKSQEKEGSFLSLACLAWCPVAVWGTAPWPLWFSFPTKVMVSRSDWSDASFDGICHLVMYYCLCHMMSTVTFVVFQSALPHSVRVIYSAVEGNGDNHKKASRPWGERRGRHCICLPMKTHLWKRPVRSCCRRLCHLDPREAEEFTNDWVSFWDRNRIYNSDFCLCLIRICHSSNSSKCCCVLGNRNWITVCLKISIHLKHSLS